MLPAIDSLREVRLLFLNPGAETEHQDGTVEVFPSGRDAHGVQAGTRVLVVRSGDAIRRVELDRPLYCNEQLFAAWHEGTLVVSDTFAEVLEWLPPAARHPDSDHLLDYLLFRTVPGTGTPFQEVRRVGQGENLVWVAGAGWSTRVAKLPNVREHGTIDEPVILDGIDAALTEATRSETGSAANLFSGGVDSTLLQSYLADTPTVTTVINSPEFEPEREYAAQSRRILQVSGEEVAYDESEYRSRLEDTIAALRLPPHHLQTVNIDAAYSTAHATYFTAQYADGIFGLGYAEHASRVWRLRAAGPACNLLGRIPVGPGRRARTFQETLSALRIRATSTASFAHRFAVYSDLPTLERIFGRHAVQARLEHRLQYVLERLPASSRWDLPGLDSNLELGHWIDVLCDDTVAIWGQLALRRGKRLIAPMTAAAVVRESLRVPASVRYVRKNVAKYWLKALLARRLPAYPAHQPKYSSGLPFWRYYETGPLRHALLDYDRPSFLPAAEWKRLDQQPTWLTWSVLTYLIWSAGALAPATPPRHGAASAQRWPYAHDDGVSLSTSTSGLGRPGK